MPVTEWGPVAGLERNVWVATSSPTETFVQAARAPNATGVSPAASKAVGARFSGLPPARVLDTRTGLGLSGPFTSGAARTFALAGRGGVPANAVAVSGTVTVTGQTSAGYLSLGPFAATLSRSSVVNVPVGDARAAGFTVALNGSGPVAAMWTGAGGSKAHVIVDVTGYFVGGASGSTFVPLTPARLLDTRTGNGLSGLMATGVPRSFQVTGRGGVPAGAKAVTGNLVAVAPNSGGYLALAPGVERDPGDLVAERAPRRRPGGVGDAAARRGGPARRRLERHARLEDARDLRRDRLLRRRRLRRDVLRDRRRRASSTAGSRTGWPAPSGRTSSGRSRRPAAARCRSTRSRVTGSLTVVGPTGAGWVIVGPGGSPLGSTSSINVPRGDIRANGFTSRTGSSGVLSMVYVGPKGTTANVILDVTGYFR